VNWPDCIKIELANRKRRNQNYSLRALSRDLKVNVSTLSEILNSKRQPSVRNAERICKSMGLSPNQRNILFSQMRRSHKENPLPNLQQLLLQEDSFQLIADWFHFGILNLAFLQNHFVQPEWIAKAFDISATEAEAGLDRLIRLGLIKIRHNRIKRLAREIVTTNDIPSAAIRRHHLQNLELARASIENDSVQKREISSATFPISSADMEAAKKMLRQFKSKFIRRFSRKKADDIYTLSFQFFSIMRGAMKNESNS
jgi:uncharacterized protein (TIGR02147 family)